MPLNNFDLICNVDAIEVTSPLYQICPNALFANSSILSMYIDMIYYLLLQASKRKDFATPFFNDIIGWSGIVSKSLLGKGNIALSSWNQLLLPKGFYADVNFRDSGICGLSAEKTYYEIDDPSYCYLPDGSTSFCAKKVYNHETGPFILDKCSGKLLKCAWLHFQGVEGKFALMKYLLPVLLSNSKYHWIASSFY